MIRTIVLRASKHWSEEAIEQQDLQYLGGATKNLI